MFESRGSASLHRLIRSSSSRSHNVIIVYVYPYATHYINLEPNNS